MSQAIQIEVPDDFSSFRLPDAVQQRLQSLLDKQDEGDELSTSERQEAEGLVQIAEFFSLLRLRSENLGG